MAHILHIIGSPGGNHSVSTRLARAWLDARLQGHPGDTLDTLDTFGEALPEFSSQAAGGKLKVMAGMPPSPDEQAAFDQTLGYIARLKAADIVLISTGMWNFGVPYRLKHWIDLVVQVGHTFGFDPARGYYGLLTGKRATVFVAAGGDYSQAPMSQADMVTPYLSSVLGFLGVEVSNVISAWCTAYPPQVSGPAVERAIELAKTAGTTA